MIELEALQTCKQQKLRIDLCIKCEFEITLQEKKIMKSEYEHIQMFLMNVDSHVLLPTIVLGKYFQSSRY